LTVCPIYFEDVPPNDPFFVYIRCLTCRALLSGYPCGGPGEPCNPPGNQPYFRPVANATRGQIAKILSNAAGYSEVIPSTQQTFEDVPPGSTFWVFIERIASRGIINGYPCGSAGEPCVGPGNRPYFRPYIPVTRGQLSKMDALTAGLTAVPTTQTFEDVPPGSTFYPWIEQLSNLGVISGYPCGGAGEPCVPPGNRPYFRPYNDVTRGQITKFVVLAAALPVVTPAGPRFADVPPTHPFYATIETAALYGVVGGYPCGGPGEPCDPQNRPYYRSGQSVTRAQFAKMLFQAFALNRGRTR
jgi:hypothetical protein